MKNWKLLEEPYLDHWGNFVFNEPYIGKELKQINNVVLQKQYLEFMEKHNGGKGDTRGTWLYIFLYHIVHLGCTYGFDAVYWMGITFS